MAIAYLGLGSNLGDRIGYVQQAVQFLKDADHITVKETSSFYETEPVGLVSEKWFVNAVVCIETSLEPEELLIICMDIERKLGRVRDPDLGNPAYQSRTLDVDVLFYDDMILAADMIIVPHPKVHERAYALVPMLEINPEYIHPILGQSVSDIHRSLVDPEEVFLYGTRREE